MGPKKRSIGVLLFVFLAALTQNAHSEILINEVLANGVIEPDSEWVELFNSGNFDVNLTGFNISETSSKNLTLSTIMPANGFIVLVENFTLFNLAFPKVNQSGIRIIEYGEIVPSFELSNSGGIVTLYNSSGKVIDSLEYKQSSSQENVSIGRYPDGSSSIFNISTLTPGAKNDNQNPRLNKWISPSRNSTNISGLAGIIVNLTDDTVQVNSSFISFNGTNFSMGKNGDLWAFLWNTSLNAQKQYNITVFFNDSYGKPASDRLLNIFVNNSPRIDSFSPSGLAQTLAENSTLNFSVNASDPDDAISFSWYVDGVLSNVSKNNFSYAPGFSDNGTHAINATVRDASSQASMKWAVTVTNINRAPVLDPISSKAFSKNVNSSFNITVSDPDGDLLIFSGNNSGIAVSKVNGSLATVSWKPSNLDLGINMINLTASDGFLSDSEIVTISVNVTNNNAPVFTTSDKITATVNEQYSYDADAADEDNDTVFFSVKANASGMSINSASGLITFNPSSAGFFSVNVSASDLTSMTNRSFFLSSIYGTRLKISDIDAIVDGRKSSNIANGTQISREAGPGSKVELRITVENEFTKSENIDIGDIAVKAVIEEIDDGDDIELEANEFDLQPEDDKTVNLKFAVPLNADDSSFDILIGAVGDDENGDEHGQFFESRLRVEKEEHDLRIASLDISPPIIECKSELKANALLLNAGTDDEENAFLEIKSDAGILADEKNIHLEAGHSGLYSKTISLEIDDVEGGSYPIIASVYGSDGELHDAKPISVAVKGCSFQEEATKETLMAGFQPIRNAAAKKESLQSPAIEITLKEDDKILLALSTFVFAMFFVSVAIILFIKA